MREPHWPTLESRQNEPTNADEHAAILRLYCASLNAFQANNPTQRGPPRVLHRLLGSMMRLITSWGEAHGSRALLARLESMRDELLECSFQRAKVRDAQVQQ